MNLNQCMFTNNNCYKAGKKIVVKGILLHSTGANNPNLRRYVGPDDGKLGTASSNHWNVPLPGGREVCVHGFIGKLKDGSIATYQTLPWDVQGWHAGGKANESYIGFEICEDDLKSKEYFNAVYKEAVELCIYLCKKYKISEKNVICHSEGHAMGIASNHSDVMHWFPKYGKSMDTLRKDVAAGLLTKSIPKKEIAPKPEASKVYRVQIGAFSVKSNADIYVADLKHKGFNALVIKIDGLYKVQCGAFSVKQNALNLKSKLETLGYKPFINS